jgi:hypothetical protein
VERLNGYESGKSSKKNVFKCKNGESRRFFSGAALFIFILAGREKKKAVSRWNVSEE